MTINHWVKSSFLLGLLISASVLFASPNDSILEPIETVKPLPVDFPQMTLTFSGLVMNENGESFGYYFQLRRNHHQFHTTVLLSDANTNTVILYEEKDALLNNPVPNDWHVGSSFVKHDSITESWIFGIKTQDKLGFNFKVDLLTQAKHQPVSQSLRKGLEFSIIQSNNLNGHLKISKTDKEQFVTGHNAWLRQIWVSKPQDMPHTTNGILCRFNDGSGFYALSLKESDALSASIAGWRDANGVPQLMSQFVHVKSQEKGTWLINVDMPKLKLIVKPSVFEDVMATKVITGRLHGDKQGFCSIDNEIFSSASKKTMVA